ncbi:MAG: patatin-like phospholipase family protein, partial [Fibrobacteria bacterium]
MRSSLIFLITMAVAAWQAQAASRPVADSSVVLEVSSGGVSLGSYQGGYLYARTLALKDSSMYRILTGASAGAINTLGGLFYSFHQPNRKWGPYKAWLQLDWNTLMRKHPEEGSLFDTNAIAAELNPILDSILTPPDNPDSIPKAIWIGFATTRFLPRTLNSKTLTSEKMDEKIVLGFQWLKKGHMACAEPAQGCWRVWTEVNPKLAQKRPQLFLDFGPNGTDRGLIRGHLKDLALASSAFPVAFQRHPVRLHLLASGINIDRYQKIGKVWEDMEAHPVRYTRKREQMDSTTLLLLPTGDKAYGKWIKTQYPTFSDGGLFENEPLNLAKHVHEDLQERYKGMKTVAALRFVLPLNYDSMFMDYDEDRIRRSAASEWLIFTRSRHSAAVERMEVTRFLEETGNEDSVFALSTTSLPLASEHFGHFSGFFAREFREFDFALGMHDAFKAALPGPEESRRERALAMVAPLDSTLHRQLAYLWDKVDTLYAANDWTKAVFKDSTQKRFQALIQAVKNLRMKVSKEVPESQDLKLISRVLQGSLSRLQGTLESLKNSGDEGSGDQF